jgi:hypothetical protein
MIELVTDVGKAEAAHGNPEHFEDKPSREERRE